MKDRLAICIAIAVTIALLTPLYTVQAQEYYAYSVQVRPDGSAVWSITQFSDLNANITSWGSYQQKIHNLVNESSAITHRAMAVDDGSLEINTTMSSESKITEYSFVWLNFSRSQSNELAFGDVFQVNNFFGQLFGDASIQLTYPQGYAPKSVYPPPYQRQDDLNLMKWARTQDLDSNVQIVLAQTQQSSTQSSLEQSSLIGIAIVAVAVPVGVVGFFFLRRRRSGSSLQVGEAALSSTFESEEDKIIKLLKASGGTMRQVEITERLGFSKAKTSQLLSALEDSGVLARYKRGRDKIVTFKKGETT